MESIEGNGTVPSTISFALMHRIKLRRDALANSDGLVEQARLFAKIKERRGEKTARNVVEIINTLNHLRFIIVNHEQNKLPISQVLQGECVAYLQILKNLYEHCVIETEDSIETKNAKQLATSYAFDLIMRTTELLLLYTRPSEARSKQKLMKMLRTGPVKNRMPENVRRKIVSAFFPERQKVVTIK